MAWALGEVGSLMEEPRCKAIASCLSVEIVMNSGGLKWVQLLKPLENFSMQPRWLI